LSDIVLKRQETQETRHNSEKATKLRARNNEKYDARIQVCRCTGAQPDGASRHYRDSTVAISKLI